MEAPMLRTLLNMVSNRTKLRLILKLNLSEMGGFFFIIGIRHNVERLIIKEGVFPKMVKTKVRKNNFD